MAMLTQSFKAKCLGDVIPADKMGFYIFGGLDHTKSPTNDIFHIKSCYKENSELFDSRTNEFFHDVDPRLYFDIKKINCKGIPPPERCMHTAEHIGAYIYIYGGKNDSLYKQIRNTALNDVHMFDIAEKEWKTVAIYGYIPMSRWGH